MTPQPGECGVALKEWAGICRALSSGRQTVLARKGGILEADGRFVPEHRSFWLHPTFVHQAEQGLREEVDEADADAADPRATVRIDCLARVEMLKYVTSMRALDVLEPFHVWQPETIRRRFSYRRPGLWVLGVRVYRREEPWLLTPTIEQLGCRSWVTLDQALETSRLRPVLDDATSALRARELKDALDHGTEITL